MERIRKNKGFDSYPNYKNLYFSYLLSFMRDLKAKYRIKNVDSLEFFEKKIGKYFENIKNTRKLSDINFKLVNQLDKNIYNRIIRLKADYNKYAPIQGNEKVIREIAYDLRKTLTSYK